MRSNGGGLREVLADHSNVGQRALDDGGDKASDMRFDGRGIPQKKFNWRPVAPTILASAVAAATGLRLGGRPDPFSPAAARPRLLFGNGRRPFSCGRLSPLYSFDSAGATRTLASYHVRNTTVTQPYTRPTRQATNSGTAMFV